MYCLVAFKNFTKELVCYKTDMNITEKHIGYRILVPYGKKNCIGILVDIIKKPTIDQSKIKPISKLLDQLYRRETIAFYRQLASYYLLSLNEIICLTTHVDLFASDTCTKDQWFCVNPALSPSSITQQKVAKLASQATCIWSLRQQLANNRIEKMISERDLVPAEPSIQHGHAKLYELSADQQKVTQSILDHWQGVHLIHGVTGSGKTEIYTHLIKRALQKKQQVLVLVPEIALTTQTANKIADRTQTPVTIIHSNLTKKQKLARVMQARSGAARILLGTRSALLCEFKTLGLIIVDEEHDSSYRHHSPLFFSAKDMAILKAHIENIPIILGSATPSLESLHNAQHGRYKLHQLHHRVHTSMPKVHLILHEEASMLSPQATSAIQNTLDAEKNVLVFIGRRGWSNLVYCIKCEWQARCKYCDQTLVLHQNHTLQCHQCNLEFKKPIDCPKCQQAELISYGYGSQQVAHHLAQLWPDNQVVRFDTDQTPTALKEQFTNLVKQKSTIIVGTQMMTKGHDLAAVQTVIVIQADQGLYSHDFRAEETLYAEMVQTSGRCGRRQQPGEVWIQTKNPHHPLFQSIQSPQAYPLSLLEKRKQYQLPPFQFIAAIYTLAEKAPNIALPDELKYILGPIPCPKGNREGKTCLMWLISNPCRKQRKHHLSWLIHILQQYPNLKTWWQVDTYLCP